MTPPSTPRRTTPPRASAAANNLAEWFRQVERLVRVARARGADCDEAAPLIERLVESFAEIVEYHAPVVLRCSALEIWLRDELVLRHLDGKEEEAVEHGLPFLLFRDGIRGLTLDPAASREDARTLLNALVRVAASPATDEDLTTLLWRADLDGLQVQLAPFEEVVPGTLPGEPAAPAPDTEPRPAGLTLVPQAPGTSGWPAEGEPANVLDAWATLRDRDAESRRAWRETWDGAATRAWTEQVERLVHESLEHDSGPLVREALATTLCSWLASAAQRCDWLEAALAHDCLRRADPEKRWKGPLLAHALAGVDAELVAGRLDESDREAQGRFFAFVVRVGRPALDMLVRVLARSARPRVRAAATTALEYICADDPGALAPYVRDARWHVARNAVFALGQLGGDDAGEPLAFALRHPDVRVRRAAVSALGQVPVHRRTPLLLGQLDSTDAATLTAVLAMLAREPDRRATAALIDRIAGADFESRPEDVRIALIGTLGEIGDGNALPALGAVLNAGGWFARRTPEREAAARALARIGSTEALEVLQAGMRSRADAVRAACLEALHPGEQRSA
jgi:HEAT repeat protein